MTDSKYADVVWAWECTTGKMYHRKGFNKKDSEGKVKFRLMHVIEEGSCKDRNTQRWSIMIKAQEQAPKRI